MAREKKPAKDAKDRAPRQRQRRGWLVLGVGEDIEVPLPAGTAMSLAEELAGQDADLPTVDEVREMAPEEVAVGTTEGGQPVSLRALGKKEPKEPKPDDGDASEDEAEPSEEEQPA